MDLNLINPHYKKASSIHEFTVRNIRGELVKLDVYNNHVCIVVNVASESQFATNHYKQFNELYEKYGESKGLRILAFPCNQFGIEEPGTSEEIIKFASERNVKFDLFEKINVNCDNASPLWKFIKHTQHGNKGTFVKWNFTKFIINKFGIPIERFGPEVEPLDIQLVKKIEQFW